MEEKELDLGEYEVTWTLAGRDILKVEIRVTDTGVTCLSVGAGGLCYSATPPGVTISAFTVTGYLKPVVIPPPVTPPPVGTCNQSFRIIEKDTNNPIAGATISLTGGKGPLTTDSYGRCNVQLETGKNYGWVVLKGGYKPGYPPLFTACTAEKSIQLEPLVAPPPAPPVQPPEVAKFGLKEIVENHLPEWISGYACASCSGGYAYKCPSGYKRTVCYVQTRLGVHGCCSSCIVAFVKCEREAPPAAPPPAATTISSWIDETGVHNLKRDHWLYAYDLYIGAESAAEALYTGLYPKPSRIPSSLVTRDNWLALYNYSIGAISAGNALSGGDY